MEIFPLY